MAVAVAVARAPVLTPEAWACSRLVIGELSQHKQPHTVAEEQFNQSLPTCARAVETACGPPTAPEMDVKVMRACKGLCREPAATKDGTH